MYRPKRLAKTSINCEKTGHGLNEEFTKRMYLLMSVHANDFYPVNGRKLSVVRFIEH